MSKAKLPNPPRLYKSLAPFQMWDTKQWNDFVNGGSGDAGIDYTYVFDEQLLILKMNKLANSFYEITFLTNKGKLKNGVIENWESQFVAST